MSPPSPLSVPPSRITLTNRHVDYALDSPFGGGRPGRVKRKRAAAAAGGDKAEGGEDEDDE